VVKNEGMSGGALNGNTAKNVDKHHHNTLLEIDGELNRLIEAAS